jgi:TPR repeat protein
VAVGAASLPATAQSVGRTRRSLDTATGGQTAPVALTRPANPAPAATAAQTAAIQAAQNRSNAEAAGGADQRVVEFLEERVESGPAEAAFDLAKRHEEGKGLTADSKEARRLQALAAERGHEDAKAWLKEHPSPDQQVVKGKKWRFGL